MNRKSLSVGVVVTLLGAMPVYAQINQVPLFGPEAARKAVDICLKMSAEKGWPMAIVALDEGGHVLYAFRLEGANYARLDFAMEKARTALMSRRPSGDLLDRMQSGKENYLFSIPDYVGMQGGLPVVSGGRVIGSIGASGATAQQDEDCVRAGIEALTGADTERKKT
jgi:uncharacterized protein GlcG (DUF336 family)